MRWRGRAFDWDEEMRQGWSDLGKDGERERKRERED